MLKMIITCRRNPSLTREGFFDHLRHTHWPMLQQYADTTRHLAGYVQNHALGPQSPESGELPVATDRDSVIELFFEDEAALHRLIEEPDYRAHIRPDEARFNDLPGNIMVRTRAETVFAVASVGRCKRFDFLARSPSITPEAFREALRADSRSKSLDPFYTGLIDRQIDNVALVEGDGADFGQGSFDGVRECWAGSFAALATAYSMGEGTLPVDRDRSFSVFTTEFVMIPPQGR